MFLNYQGLDGNLQLASWFSFILVFSSIVSQPESIKDMEAQNDTHNVLQKYYCCRLCCLFGYFYRLEKGEILNNIL